MRMREDHDSRHAHYRGTSLIRAQSLRGLLEIKDMHRRRALQ